MLQVLLALFKDEANDNGRDQGKAYGDHKSEVEGIASFLAFFEDVEHWERLRSNCEVEVGVIVGCPKNRRIDVLREKCSDIL